MLILERPSAFIKSGVEALNIRDYGGQLQGFQSDLSVSNVCLLESTSN